MVISKPFLKWVGGKQQLIAQFEPLFPAEFHRYIEPFVGGGAIFFHLQNHARLPQQTFLFDHNLDLVNAYRVVRDQVDDLITLLTLHRQNHNKKYYYHVRSLDRRGVPLSSVEQAARMIYLNKTCYNGLYRVNNQGQFNVPIGSYRRPRIFHEDALRTASAALQHTCLEKRDFRDMVSLARPGDFFYFDPPYDPVSHTASFTGYTSDHFGRDDQGALAETFAQLSDRGCLCMLSNSHTQFILDLYRDFRIEIVRAKRVVNSDANGRGPIPEVVVMNY